MLCLFQCDYLISAGAKSPCAIFLSLFGYILSLKYKERGNLHVPRQKRPCDNRLVRRKGCHRLHRKAQEQAVISSTENL